MTVDELIAEAARKRGWTVDNNGRIRLVRTVKGMKMVCCPITCGIGTLRPTWDVHSSDVAHQLGLSYRALSNIVNAADNQFQTSTQISSARKKMIKAFGLEEVTA